MKHGKNLVKIKQLYKSTFSISKSWFLARWLVKLLCLVELFLEGIVSQQLKYIWQLYPYVCIPNMYNYNLLLLCTSRSCYPFPFPEVLGTAQRVCQRRERTISWGRNALKGFCSHERNKCQAISQAAVSVCRGTLSLVVGSSWAWPQLSCSCGSCSTSWALSPLGNPHWRGFLALCVTNPNLLKIIVHMHPMVRVPM